MIDFSKDAVKSVQTGKTIKTEDSKKIRNRPERPLHINYDFADSDVQKEQPDNAMIGRKVQEEEKIEKPEPVQKKQKSRFDNINGGSYEKRKDDIELSK